MTPERVREWERIAGDPTLTPDALRDLARQLTETGFAASDAIAVLVGNPNCPLDVLAGRVALHPDAFLANPVLPLLPLENPALLSELTTEDVLTLLMRQETPPPYVRLARDHPDPDVSSSARYHLHNAGEADPQSAEWMEEVFDAAGAMPLGDVETLYERVELGLIPRRVAARLGYWPVPDPHPAVPEGDAAPADEDPPARLPAPPGGWRGLLALPRPDRLPYALHPDTPPDALRLLANDLSTQVAEALARHPRTPSDVLDRLIRFARGASRVHRLAARHPNASPELLATFFKFHIALPELARHPHTPPEVLQGLSGANDAAVRRLARRHRALPPDGLRAARDRSVAAAFDGKPNAVGRDVQAFLVAAQRRLDNAVLDRCRRSLTWPPRLVVAVNPFTPPEMLAALEDDGHCLIRAAARARRYDYDRTPFRPLFSELPPEAHRPVRPPARPPDDAPETGRDKSKRGKKRR